MRAQTSPLLTLIAVVIGGAILFLLLCAGVFLLVNPFRAPTTVTPASGQRATVLVTQVVVITATPAPTKPGAATAAPPQPTIAPQGTTAPQPTTIYPTIVPTAIPLSPTAKLTPAPNEPLTSVSVSTEGGGTGIRINVRYADGSPARDVYSEVYRQKQDVSGNPVRRDRIASGSTDNSGTKSFDVPPDTYVVAIGLTGYLYGEQFNHQVQAGTIRVLDVTLGQILVGVLDADSKAVQDRYVEIYKQKPDLSGNPVTDDRVASGSTDNTGAVQFNLTAGDYRVGIDGLAGDPWGELFNHRVTSGETNRIIVRLGRLTVGLKDASGKPIGDRYVQVFLQKRDVAGNISQGKRVSSGSTQNTGLLNLELTPGRYIVEVSDVGKLIDVPIESGRITYSDGASFELQ
ncbi:MAG: hypothetical protein B6D41_22165 [Chloroflexi bacterium UTCFX4]|jgi:hypothetical protein|nr:MAG: hypothetical protein B6D41_22165 [Chloroflexi bacterium UTCFX4]